MIKTIAEAEAILRTYVPAVSKTGDDQSLERMWPALQVAGNPHEALRVVHVAGTSGKTSTSYYIAAQLAASGKKVGLTVSPHVDTITERLQINGEPISNESFCSYLEEFLQLVDGIELSYFELLIVFVLWVFAREHVDYVVLETGMGGLFDGTNVVTRKDKVCVITDIGYDHMNILGNTLEQIAFQKAGIVHERNVVFSQQQEPEAAKVINTHCAKMNAELHVITKEIAKNSQSNSYQSRNWLLARMVADYIAMRDGLKLAKIDPSSITIPGRIEKKVLVDGSILLMDGAHNGQKMTAFVESVQSQYPNRDATVLLALKQGKEVREVLQALKPIAGKLIITEFTSYQDLPFKAISATAIAEQATVQGMDAAIVHDYAKALEALFSNDGLKIITGSFYLLSDIRKLL